VVHISNKFSHSCSDRPMLLRISFSKVSSFLHCGTHTYSRNINYNRVYTNHHGNCTVLFTVLPTLITRCAFCYAMTKKKNNAKKYATNIRWLSAIWFDDLRVIRVILFSSKNSVQVAFRLKENSQTRYIQMEVIKKSLSSMNASSNFIFQWTDREKHLSPWMIIYKYVFPNRN